MPIEAGGATEALEVTPIGGEGDGGDGEGTEIPGSEGGEGGESGEGGEPQYEIDESTGETKLDDAGNPIPKTTVGKPEPFKATYEKIKASDPKAAEVFRKEHFGYEKYKTIFPTTAEATQAKELIDNYGGSEGIQELNDQAQTYASEMEKFSTGDPQFIAQLAKEDPEGFAKSISQGLITLGNTNEAAYSAALVPIIHRTLESTGITESVINAANTISQLYEGLKGTADAQTLVALTKAYEGLEKSFKLTEGWRKRAEASSQQPQSEEAKRIQQERQQLNQERAKDYSTKVSQAMAKTTDGHINTALQGYYKQFPKMTKDQKADVHNGTFEYIAKQLQSNPSYQKQMKALVQVGDIAKIDNFVSQNVKKIVAASAKAVWNRRGFGTVPGTKTNVAASGSAGTVKLGKPPKYSDLDFTEDPGKTEYMMGRGTLKGSKKKITWDWSAA